MKNGARTINPDQLKFTPRFAYGDQAQLAAVCSAEDGTKLGSGYVRLANAEIPWTIKYDEVLLVLEGEMTVRTADGNLTAGPQESIWLPAGTELTYFAENALVFYAIHPNDWNAE